MTKQMFDLEDRLEVALKRADKKCRAWRPLHELRDEVVKPKITGACFYFEPEQLDVMSKALSLWLAALVEDKAPNDMIEKVSVLLSRITAQLARAGCTIEMDVDDFHLACKAVEIYSLDKDTSEAAKAVCGVLLLFFKDGSYA